MTTLPELLEHGSGQVAGSLEDMTKVSIAISLKRIADALSQPNAYGEVGSEALSIVFWIISVWVALHFVMKYW